MAAEKPASDQAATPTLPLRWLLLAMALGLVLSITLNVWIALSLPRSHRVTLALLLIEAAVPVLPIV